METYTLLIIALVLMAVVIGITFLYLIRDGQLSRRMDRLDEVENSFNDFRKLAAENISKLYDVNLQTIKVILDNIETTGKINGNLLEVVRLVQTLSLADTPEKREQFANTITAVLKEFSDKAKEAQDGTEQTEPSADVNTEE